MNKPTIVIDLFAGPGGLSEGFTKYKENGNKIFEIGLSIEKDPTAYQTLLLRSIFRKFSDDMLPTAYLDYITGKIDREKFLSDPEIKPLVEEALHETKNITLGDYSTQKIDAWIKEKVGMQKNWVLIGGPPCQAYSLVGRSKMINLDKEKYESDHRHLLYKEYLRIIQKHEPSVFIMENVKGILSSKLNEEFIFKQILKDLKQPKKGLAYDIRSLTIESNSEDISPNDYIIKSEQYGIPQARHRVILFGIRKDLAHIKHQTLIKKTLVTVDDAFIGLPVIRSKFSKQEDSHINWMKCLNQVPQLIPKHYSKTHKLLIENIKKYLTNAELSTQVGSEYIESNIYKNITKSTFNNWIMDARLLGINHHAARGHIREDIQRYFFFSATTAVLGKQIKVNDLPKKLLPNHKNIHTENIPFTDRFRVQSSSTVSSTIVSHISKDGHHYIHPDPSQARSLTVREAARLQTFPDNYFFEGTRTQQYVQVGNAVPPLLAYQIAEIVAALLKEA